MAARCLLRIFTSARAGAASPGQEIQFTSRAISRERSRSSLRPTITRCVAGSVAITYSGSAGGDAEPAPLAHREVMHAGMLAQRAAVGR